MVHASKRSENQCANVPLDLPVNCVKYIRISVRIIHARVVSVWTLPMDLYANAHPVSSDDGAICDRAIICHAIETLSVWIYRFWVRHDEAIDAYAQKDWRAPHALESNPLVNRIHVKIAAFAHHLLCVTSACYIRMRKLMKIFTINTIANVRPISMAKIVKHSSRPTMCWSSRNQVFTTMSNSMGRQTI